MIKQLLICALLLIIMTVLFEHYGIDAAVQNMFYQNSSGTWLIDRDNAILKLLFYDGIKLVYFISVVALLVLMNIPRKFSFIESHRQGLRIVLLSTIIVPLVIGSLKSVTNVPCPKNVTGFGGNIEHVSVLGSYSPGRHPQQTMRCYPAAHASGGFALMSLYFLFTTRRARRIALTCALSIGWSTGLYKMAIGDHFLSHTIASMLLAWMMILLIKQSVINYWPVSSR